MPLPIGSDLDDCHLPPLEDAGTRLYGTEPTKGQKAKEVPDLCSDLHLKAHRETGDIRIIWERYHAWGANGYPIVKGPAGRSGLTRSSVCPPLRPAISSRWRRTASSQSKLT